MRILGVFLAMAVVSSTGNTSPVHPYKSQFENLDDFSLMGIFDHLPLTDLTNIALSSPRFTEIISNYYITSRFRLNEREIQILVHTETARITVDTQSTRIASDLKETLRVLEMFGDAFLRVDARFYSLGSQTSLKIFEHLSEYCSNAFLMVTLHSMAPFKTAFSSNHTNGLTLNNIIPTLDPIQLNAFFPNIESIIVRYPRDLLFIQSHFSHLVDFALDIKASGGVNQFFWNFLKLNSQIRSFQTPLFKDPSFFKRLNEALSDLETLTVVNNGVTRDEIMEPVEVCFKDVRKFTLNLNFYYLFEVEDTLPTIAFERLESFKLHGKNIGAIEGLFGFLGENSKLKELDLGDSTINHRNIGEIIDLLEDLRDISVGCPTVGEINQLRLLLGDERSNQLQKIYVKTSPEIRTEIFEAFPCHWKQIGESNGGSHDDSKIILMFQRL